MEGVYSLKGEDVNNAIIDLDNYALGSYVYNIEPHQAQLLVAAAGIADLASKGELDDRNVRIDIPSTDNFAEAADVVALQIYNLVEAAMPYFSQQTLYENVLFATLVGFNSDKEISLEERSGHFIGEYLPAQESIDRTDLLVSVVDEANRTPVRDDYSNLEWAMFYLEGLVALDQENPELSNLKPGSRASKKAWDIIDGYRYVTKRTYGLDG